jgi:hypothetical protein
LPVRGRTPADIRSRADTLNDLAIRQLWNPRFVELMARFERPAATILSECYFALTEAYKIRWRLGGRTEWTKVAALTAATIAVVKPLRPSSRSDVSDVRWPYLNPSFAIFAAYDGIPQAFYALDFDEQRRVLRALRDAELRCLRPIIAEGNSTDGKYVTEWSFSFDDPQHCMDAAFLDILISYFESLKREEKYRLRLGGAGLSL